MYTAYTNWLAENYSSIDWNDPDLRIRAHFFVRSSGFISGVDEEPNDIVIAEMTTLQDILDHPGWQMILPSTSSIITTWSASSETVGDITKVSISDEPVNINGLGGITYLDSVALTLTSQTYISENGLYANLADNELLSVYRFESPLLFGGTDVSINDELLAILGQDQEARYLFSFDSSDPEELVVDLPHMVAKVPVLGWESAHTVHVWLKPSRVNYVANPSFEDEHAEASLPFGWRSNVDMSYEFGGIGPVPREYCGKFEGAEPVKVAEANLFPVSGDINFYSVEAAVSEPGTYRIGILFWERGMDPEDVLFFSKEFEVASGDGNFQILKTLFVPPEEVWCGQFRIEYEGDSDFFLLDNVIVEPNESQAPYFDGSWDLGQPGDADWYGSDVMPRNLVAHRSFSTYYPDRVRVRRYLFGYADTTADHTGAVYNHVPEMNQVIPHWDDVYYSYVHPWAHSVRIPVIDFPLSAKSSVAVLP